MRATQQTDAITIESWLLDGDERLANDVLHGLTRPFKELPPKHIYDSRGSELFEQIRELPEYYPARVETAILGERAAEIVAATRAGELVELGSGAGDKARTLLDAMDEAGTLSRYVPFDVSESVVRGAAEQLVKDYDGLRIHGVIGDFEVHLPCVPARNGAPRLVAMLGGTIGNLAPAPRRRLMRGIASLLGDGDHLLLGTDLVKDTTEIEAAYDDSLGVTAEFNRNVLHVINRELGGDFEVDAFEHVAFFDHDREWIEMRLRARRAMTVRVNALALDVVFAEGEEIRTEVSAKFTIGRVRADLAAAGLRLDRWLTDDQGRFALSLASLER